MPKEHNCDRRRFLGAALTTFAVGPLVAGASGTQLAIAGQGRRTTRPEGRNLTGGIGHNLPQEAPQAFAAAIIDVDAL